MSGRVLTVEDVLSECYLERCNSTTKLRFKTLPTTDTYKQAWSAVNLWIESRLGERKGAALPVLGSFTWEFKKQNGELIFRPVFVMSESFAKDHHIRKFPSHSSPIIAPIEEINFSKVAIKFSTSLTKDMAFFGIRDIIKKIGDFIDRMAEIEIVFSFGVLKSKERKLKFEFDQSRMSELMYQRTSSGELYTPDEIVFFGSDSLETLNTFPKITATERISSSRSSVPNTPSTPTSSIATAKDNSVHHLPIVSSPRTQSPRRSMPPTDSGAAKKDRSEGTVMYRESEIAYDDDKAKSLQPQPLSPGVQAILAAMEENQSADKDDTRHRACERVLEQAYTRCISDLEQKARDEEELYNKKSQEELDWLRDEEIRKEKSRTRVKDLKEFLDGQVDASRQRKNIENEDRRNSVAAYILPVAQATKKDLLGSSSSSSDALKSHRERLSSDLLKQSWQKRRESVQEKHETEREEREYLNHVNMEMDIDAIAERASKLEKQRILLESWEKESHVNNLRKLKPSADSSIVSDYIRSNLPDLPSVSGRQDASSSLNMVTGIPSTFRRPGTTVGFDSRRGR